MMGLPMKLYTRTGDDGNTGLLGGTRVAKDTLRVDAFGTVDELNCAVGLARCACGHTEITHVLHAVQQRLFEVGAELASLPVGGSDGSGPRIDTGHLRAVEKQIDGFCASFGPMKHFILPGGGELAARLHLARAICRRAERLCVALSRREVVNQHLLVYMNRLSDLLFAVARRANQLEGIEDLPWMAKGQ